MEYTFFKKKKYVREEVQNDLTGLYIYADNPEDNSPNESAKQVRYLGNARPIRIICRGSWPLNDSNYERVVQQLTSDIKDIMDAWLLNNYESLYYPEEGFRTLSDYCINKDEIPQIYEAYTTKLKAMLDAIARVTEEERIWFVQDRLKAYMRQNKANSPAEILEQNRKNLLTFLRSVLAKTPQKYIGILATAIERVSPTNYALINLTEKEITSISLSAIKYGRKNRLPDPDKFRKSFKKWVNG